MGGYGALKLGLAKSENFAAVISLSGAVSVGNRMDDLLMVRKAAFGKGSLDHWIKSKVQKMIRNTY